MLGVDVKYMQEITNDNIAQDAQMENGGEGETRSNKRIKDLADKTTQLVREKEELAQKHEVEKAELLKAKSDAEFRANFMEMGSKYPQSKEFEADIKAKVSSGYTLEDATVSVLASKGILGTAPTRQEQISSSAGGSADTPIREAQRNDPSFGGDRAKMRAELLDLEAKGDIGLRR